MTVEDCSELMSKQWANDTFASPEDFDPDNDLFFPLVLCANKTGTVVNQWYLLEPWMFTTPHLQRCIRESATSWRHLGFLPSLDHIGKSAFESRAQHQLKAKRSCNCVMTFCRYFFRKLNMWLQTSW
jgi:hypothetical protein